MHAGIVLSLLYLYICYSVCTGTNPFEMESAVTDPDGQTELCDVIDEDDSHYRVTFTPKQNGKHILSIRHKAMHVSG